MSAVGIVIIGRNEGERLARCIASLKGNYPTIYVDSGSTDGSAATARQAGVDTLDLDPPFSAAKARNLGFSKLAALNPDLEFVQFIDGDCDLIEGWFGDAIEFLNGNPETGIVCGIVLEKHPDASIYNRLCHLEWQRTPGPIKACGGIFMIRANVFKNVAGFREDVIAAEDDELCLRVRETGSTVMHLERGMVFHDTAMFRFSQWWRRTRRCGHAYAQGAALHGRGSERHFVRNCRSVWFWTIGIPLMTLLAVVAFHVAGLLVLLAYPLLFFRIYRNARRRGWSGRDALIYAQFQLIAKFPILLGMLQFYRNRIVGQQPQIIEYKKLQPLRSTAQQQHIPGH